VLLRLGDVHRNPPCLISYEQLGCRPPPRLILEIDTRELLSVVIPDDEAGGLFFDGRMAVPQTREARTIRSSRGGYLIEINDAQRSRLKMHIVARSGF
jgi:hypothetical protein